MKITKQQMSFIKQATKKNKTIFVKTTVIYNEVK